MPDDIDSVGRELYTFRVTDKRGAMRRPLLFFLFAQSIIILILACLDPFGLGSLLLPSGKLSEMAGELYTAEGVVTNAAVKQRYAAVTVDTGREKILIRLSVTDADAAVYDLLGRNISATGVLSLPDARRNPGGFDYRLYLKGRKVYTIMDVSRYRLAAGGIKRPVLHWLSVKKGQFYQAVRPYMSEKEFQITAGLLFGETSYMDEDLYEQFRLNGIAHVLAVSGLHVGLLYSLVLKLLGGRRGTASSLATAACLAVYAALSGFSVSVLRASCMIALNLLSFHLRRRYDLVCAASLTAIVFLFVNPWQLFDTGFQLSFTAAYSIGIALPWAESKGIELSDKYKKRWILTAFEIFSPSFMVQLGMVPLILFHFLTLSPVSMLINPPAVLLAGLLLPCGLAGFLFSLLLSGSVLAAAAGPARAFAFLLGLLSDAGGFIGGSGYFPAPTLQALALYYIAFFWFFSETRVVLRRRGKRFFAILTAAFLSCAALLMPKGLGLSDHIHPLAYDTHPITFVDVGQGDCIHICTGGKNILVDGGGNAFSDIAERTMRPYLLKSGISHIDTAYITHEDIDHALGIRQLQEIFQVDECIKLGETNEDCGILRIDTEGFSALLMADADIAREKLLCSMHGPELACNILKLGHHGSAGSTGPDLLQCARPHMAIISCGRNNRYGHPADRVIELLENSGIIYARTDTDGAVYLKSAENGLLVFENAAKDKQWLIRTTDQTQSTPQRP